MQSETVDPNDANLADAPPRPELNVLFVCTGNTCRSPMAEAIFRHRMASIPNVYVASAGVHAGLGIPISLEAVDVLREIGIDADGATSQPVLPELLEDADLIIAMTARHAAILLQIFPDVRERLTMMHAFGSDVSTDPGEHPEHEPAIRDVLDPVGGSLDVYRHTRDELDSAIADLILFLREQDLFQEPTPSSQTNTPTTHSPTMKVALGSDHGGFELKSQLVAKLKARGIEVEDCGTHSAESVDYPDFASSVARKVSEGSAHQGVLVCTTGIGMSITANKFPHVRAALCFTPHLARMARTHNNANVLALPGGNLSEEDVDGIINEWFSAEFEGGRHARRLRKIDQAMLRSHEPLALHDADPELYDVIRAENARQIQNIELIASENYASSAVREVNGSLLTNKYAEGYPGKRWYNGCEFVDQAEQLAIDRAKQIFGCDHANVQPHSGSTANQAVYFAMLKPGDTILSMSLAHGGHLTHGMALNFSGALYNVVHYGVDQKTERIDYDEIEALANEHKPKMILCGASAYPRILEFERLGAIAKSIDALLMADIAHIAGLVAAKLHPDPIPHCDFVTTTTHKTLRGPRGGLIMCREEHAKAIDKQIFPGVQGGPLMHTIAAKAVCFFEALQPDFVEYQQQVIRNAAILAGELVKGDLRIVSGGTDNHLMLVDLNPINVTGKDAATWLDEACITVNKNAIPFDDKSPFVTSGIRIGSPAVTTRGMREPEMVQIAEFITRVLKSKGDANTIADVKAEVADLTAGFPVP